MICPNCGFDNVPGSESCTGCQQDLTHLDRPNPYDRFEQALLADDVRMLNPVKPVSIRPDQTLRDAMDLMVTHNVGAVLVVSDNDAVVGILSERDLLNRVAGQAENYADWPVSRVMTPKPVTVTPEEKIAFILHKMDVGDYRHLPVVDQGQAMGMISVRDVLRYIVRRSAAGSQA